MPSPTPNATVLHSPFLPDVLRYALGHDYGVWFASGTFKANFGMRVDHLTGTMLMVVTPSNVIDYGTDVPT